MISTGQHSMVVKAGIVVCLLLVAVLAGCLAEDDEDVGPSDAEDEGSPGSLVTIDPNHDPLALGAGDYAFWKAPTTDTALIFDYTIQVKSEGARLRVASDRAAFYGEDRLELRDPAGDLVDAMGGGYSAEVFADDPESGDWTLRVYANGTDDHPMRMRAKLEEAREPYPSATVEDEAVALLPNLRPLVPLDLHFWLTYANTGVAGRVPIGSCHADEVVEDDARRCLRFAFGYGNIGDGPFEVLFRPVEDGLTQGKVEQRVRLSDGTSELRDGGTYEYHATHGHYHYDGILHADLYRVLDEQTGYFEPIVEGAKRGACAHDYRFAHFDAFIAAPRGEDDSGSDCGAQPGGTSPTDARIGLSRGWTDIYGALLQDNYVEASDINDGLHVLRVTIDADEQVAETNETDNVGYAYFEVHGDTIAVLERGLGKDPWDERKIVTEEWVP